jgi:hypothetical protein
MGRLALGPEPPPPDRCRRRRELAFSEAVEVPSVQRATVARPSVDSSAGMERRSIDWVRLYVSGTFVEISWAARNELIERLERVFSGASLINLFQRHGTSSIVAPDSREIEVLRKVVSDWAEEVDLDSLPEGIPALRDALVDDADPGDEAA